MTPYRVGVVIVTWNNADTIQACLRSLLTQSDVELQVVVVDNASTDDTCLETLAAEVSTLELIRNEENLGFARGANIGAATVESPFLLFLNPDTVFREKHTLIDCVSKVESDHQVGTLGPKMLLGDGRLQPTAFAPPSLGREVVEALGLYKLLPRPWRGAFLLGPHWDHQQDREVGWLLGAFLLVPRRAWQTLGGFTEDFHMFAEDLDWGVRVREAGWTNFFLSSTWISHASGHSGEIRWGSDRSAISFTSYYRWLDTRRGRARRVASAWINFIGFTLRYVSYATRVRIKETEATAFWKAEYQRLTAFHLRLVAVGQRALYE